jgi:hypothetical protein
MAGKEEGYRPEGQEDDPRLPRSEASRLVGQYIKKFKQTIENTPEFQQAVATKRTKVHSYGYGHDTAIGYELKTVIFKKGGYTYSAYYNHPGYDREEYDVQKEPTIRKRHDKRYESVKLLFLDLRDSEESHSKFGIIEHIKYDINGEYHSSSNRPSTLRDIDEFLITNFGEPLDQP